MNLLEVYTNAAVAGVPILGLVFGLAYFWGVLGLSGRRQLLASVSTGFVLGMVYMVIQVRPPTGDPYLVFVYWAVNAIYALGMGLVPSGAYESMKLASKKGQQNAIQEMEATAVRGAVEVAPPYE